MKNFQRFDYKVVWSEYGQVLCRICKNNNQFKAVVKYLHKYSLPYKVVEIWKGLEE